MDVRVSIAPKRSAAVDKAKPRTLDWDLPGFGPQAKISTSFGDVPAQLLHERDQVRTASGAFRRIQWLRRIGLDEDFLKKYPQAFPIAIKMNALGSGIPGREVLVSPNQRFHLKTAGPDSKPVTAMELTARPNIQPRPVPNIVYTIFHCGEPCLVRCEGLWALTRP